VGTIIFYLTQKILMTGNLFTSLELYVRNYRNLEDWCEIV